MAERWEEIAWELTEELITFNGTFDGFPMFRQKFEAACKRIAELEAENDRLHDEDQRMAGLLEDAEARADKLEAERGLWERRFWWMWHEELGECRKEDEFGVHSEDWAEGIDEAALVKRIDAVRIKDGYGEPGEARDDG